MAASRRPGSWRRAAGFLFVLVAFTFLALFVVRNAAQLREHAWSIRPIWLILSLLLNIAALAWGVAVWRRLLRLLGWPVAYLDLARIWFVSGLGRYIPGKIWQFVGAAQLGARIGLSPAVTVTSLAVHTGFFLVGAGLVAIYLVPSALGGTDGTTIILARIAAPAFLLLGHPALVRMGLRLVRRWTPAESLEWKGSWLDGAGLVLLSAIGWGISGLAFHIFVLSLTPLPSSALGGVIGINALAFVAGYVVFIAPAGLGAKETALAALLSVYIAAPAAAVIAIAARVWMVAAEVVPALLLLRLRRSRTARPPDRKARRPARER